MKAARVKHEIDVLNIMFCLSLADSSGPGDDSEEAHEKVGGGWTITIEKVSASPTL